MKYFLKHIALKQKIKEHARVVEMDKKRLKIALAVLDAVKSRFPETQEFNDSTLMKNVKKER